MMKPEKGFNLLHPTANKKKHVQHTKHHRTPKEKRERIWGKTPQKPYISSSLGDMARVMMRYSCMGNTYFYNTEPPPVEFYDYWQKFKVENTDDPADFVDLQRTSIANIKKNTSSFDFFGKYCAPIRSSHDIDVVEQKDQKDTKDVQRLSDIWKDVRTSMSSESFISSSTKISESGSKVNLEAGWDSADSGDYVSSESDFGFDIQDHHRHHLHRQPWRVAEETHEEKVSSLEFHTPQGLIDKQANAITQSILAMQKRDNRVLYDLATQPRDLDIIDHFADDLDDSFLEDPFSYSDLPDTDFGPDFDFFNEDILYKRMNKKRAKGKGQQTNASYSTESIANEEGSDKNKSIMGGADSVLSTQSECQEGSDKEECVKKKVEKQLKKKHAQKAAQDEKKSGKPEKSQYAACLERNKNRRKVAKNN